MSMSTPIPMPAKSPPPPPILPPEIILLITSVAAASHRGTAARLCLVSTWVRYEVEPILYRVLAMACALGEERALRSHFPKFQALTRCLGVVNTPFQSESLESQRAGRRLPGIRNLAVDDPLHFRLVQASGIEELHAFTYRLWEGASPFPHLQRLHLCGERSFSLVGDVLREPRLTHIALSVCEEDSISNIESAVVLCLREHPPLVLLLVRLLPFGWGRAGEMEAIEAHLTLIGDLRLVVRHASVSRYTGALFNEWERNALTGESIWDEAQLELSARLSTAPCLGLL